MEIVEIKKDSSDEICIGEFVNEIINRRSDITNTFIKVSRIQELLIMYPYALGVNHIIWDIIKYLSTLETTYTNLSESFNMIEELFIYAEKEYQDTNQTSNIRDLIFEFNSKWSVKHVGEVELSTGLFMVFFIIGDYGYVQLKRSPNKHIILSELEIAKAGCNDLHFIYFEREDKKNIVVAQYKDNTGKRHMLKLYNDRERICIFADEKGELL